MNLTDLVLAEVIHRLSMDNISESKKESYKEKLKPIIEQRVLNTIISTLTDEEMAMLSDKNLDELNSIDILSLLSENKERDLLIGEAMEKLIDELTTIPYVN